MDTKPDTIKVSALHREEIFASHANLFVTVRGSSVVSGSEAMKKAREVSQLVEALTSFGLSPEAVQLLGVHIETSSGTLLKSSSATYRLRIRVDKLDQIAESLDIIASQRNSVLERIEWKYPEESAQERGLEAAISKGKAKAEKVSGDIGLLDTEKNYMIVVTKEGKLITLDFNSKTKAQEIKETKVKMGDVGLGSSAVVEYTTKGDKNVLTKMEFTPAKGE